MRALELLARAAALVLAASTAALAAEPDEVAPRIFGGRPSGPDEFTFVAYVRMSSPEIGTTMCTGSLISPNTVLLAAHCTFGNGKRFQTGDFQVGFSHQATPLNKPFYGYGVKQIYTNPHFNLQTLRNDLALLVLNETIPESVASTVKVYVGKVNVNTPITAAGFGRINGSPDAPVATQLLQVDLRLGSPEYCSSLISGYNATTLLCTDGTPDKDTCAGDSGGPLVTPFGPDGVPVLLGVTDFAPANSAGACGVAGSTGAYVRVSGYIDWIAAATEMSPSEFTVLGVGASPFNSTTGPDRSTTGTESIDASSDGGDESIAVSGIETLVPISPSDSEETDPSGSATVAVSGVLLAALAAALAL